MENLVCIFTFHCIDLNRETFGPLGEFSFLTNKAFYLPREIRIRRLRLLLKAISLAVTRVSLSILKRKLTFKSLFDVKIDCKCQKRVDFREFLDFFL